MSNQLDLFRTFYGADKSCSANLFTAWDFYPVYSVSRKEQAKLRKEDRNLPTLIQDFYLNGQAHTITITPAILETENRRVEFYPSNREEFVEHALRRIFVEQRNAIHNPGKETWVKFSLKQLQKELSASGHTMPVSSIKESLDILVGCLVVVTQNKKKAYKGGVISSVLYTDREDYESTGKSVCAVRFNDLITQSIDRIAFRQMNYHLYMSCKRSASRWIYKRLVRNFRNAGFDAPPYKIHASEIISECRLIYSRTRDAWSEIRKALAELRSLKDYHGNHAVIPDDSIDYLAVREEPVKSGSIKVDIVFVIMPSRSFIRFVKAANARDKMLLNRS